MRIKLPKSRDFSKQRFVMSHCFEICVSQWAILKTVKARRDTAAATGHAHIDIAQFLSHCTTKIRLLFLHYCKAGFLN